MKRQPIIGVDPSGECDDTFNDNDDFEDPPCVDPDLNDDAEIEYDSDEEQHLLDDKDDEVVVSRISHAYLRVLLNTPHAHYHVVFT